MIGIPCYTEIKKKKSVLEKMIASLIFIFTVTSMLNDTKHNTGFRNPKLIISLLNDYSCFKAKAKPQNSASKTRTCTPKKNKKQKTKNCQGKKIYFKSFPP